MLELVETDDEIWKARVYWYHREPVVDYFAYRAVKDQVYEDIRKWCGLQECNSLLLQSKGPNCGIAFESLADAMAFSLYWTDKLAGLVRNNYTPDI